jgi:hypothetical protein
VDYTLAGAKAFYEHLAPQLPEGRQFRFVFCSGKFAEWDQTKPLKFMADTRRVKVGFAGICYQCPHMADSELPLGSS